MKVEMAFTESELTMLLIAMNVEKARQIAGGPPGQRKLATELRDRLAEKVLQVQVSDLHAQGDRAGTEYAACAYTHDPHLYSIDGEVVMRTFDARAYSVEEIESILRTMKSVQDAADDNDYFPESDPTLDGSGGRRCGAGIY